MSSARKKQKQQKAAAKYKAGATMETIAAFEEVQLKTQARWVQAVVSPRGLRVADLRTDLSDGARAPLRTSCSLSIGLRRGARGSVRAVDWQVRGRGRSQRF